jgi:hypothetical protein
LLQTRTYHLPTNQLVNPHDITRCSSLSSDVVNPYDITRCSSPSSDLVCEQNQLKAHRPFSSVADFKEYVYQRHDSDWEAAYEEFARFNDSAPACCKDDFRTIEFEEEGEEIHDPDAAPGLHPDFQLYQAA